MSEKLLKDILRVYGINSARVVIREDLTDEQLIDYISGMTDDYALEEYKVLSALK